MKRATERNNGVELSVGSLHLSAIVLHRELYNQNCSLLFVVSDRVGVHGHHARPIRPKCR